MDTWPWRKQVVGFESGIPARKQKHEAQRVQRVVSDSCSISVQRARCEDEKVLHEAGKKEEAGVRKRGGYVK